ncbi:extracellular solute-binding protein [Cohnella sp. REN36]|uniref:extracellular solute-binding protein n=1 Tax=Cohnella sp. REN36 TaxID=2887347 RepID=UPI001D13905C|nr:extracellular solute-binding protein [Cohnella sp. REN36]MCC3372043.1 extracellular solute-binding protein [Cohnella sp. REN36]
MNKVKSMAKSILPAISLVILGSSCFQSGHAVSNPESSDKQGATSYSEPGLSRYASPVELTFARQTSDDLDNLLGMLGETLEDNRWSRLYEQVLGIKVKYVWTAKGNLFFQKMGVALASGDIPDVVRVDARQLRQLYIAGKIQDLTTVYDQYATPFAKRTLGQEGSSPFEAATLDGKLMGIPDISSSIEGANFLWIRTDWLKTLGLQPPKTMADVLVISKAFTEGDPDRNGKNDTYGLGMTSYLFDPVAGVSGLMAGYKAYPNLWVKDGDGKLVFGGIQPEVKTALKALQDLYRSGQIDSEFGIKDGLKVRDDVTAGKIGMVYGQQWSSFWVQGSAERDPNADWQAFPIVSESGEPPKVPLPFSTSQFWVVRQDYPHPEAIVKLINLHLEKNWGETADYKTYYSTPLPAWELSPVTPFPAKKNLDAYRQLADARRTGNGSALKDEALSIQKNIETYQAGGVNRMDGWGWERTYGPKGAFSILDRYEKNGQLLYESFVGGPTPTMIEKQSILDNLLNDTYINIILGRPLDDFDRFVDEWRRVGGDRITEEVNRWYAIRGSRTN